MALAKFKWQPGVVVLLLISGFTAVLLGSTVDAHAAKRLSMKERKSIVNSARLSAPNGDRIKHASCIAGRKSTVDPRYAGIYLSNTAWCVARYGGASGEGVLLKRKSKRAKKWRNVGSFGDNCMRGTGGASTRVLRDLGCTVY